MSIKDRFKMVMDREKLTAGAFAESIGVAQATISHILGPRNKYPSTEVILRLHQRYNDINLEWLLTGKGNMSNNPDSPENDGFDYPYSPRIRKICPTGRKNLKSQGNCIRDSPKIA